MRAKPIGRTKITAGSVAIAALLGATTVGEGTAHAIDPATVVAAIKTAYSIYSEVRKLLGGDGPSLASQIRAVQEAVIGELRSQRNLALQSNTRTVLNLFTNLADNQRGDPTNDELWSDILTLQQTTADAMFDIIWNTTDVTSAYELAPAYNLLIATGTGVLKIKGEIWPSFPSSWLDFHIWLRVGMIADYKMVAAARHECYPGFNPGYRNPALFAPNVWSSITRRGKYEDSYLYTKKIANKSIHVETYKQTCSTRTGTSFFTSKRDCNPGRKTCDTISPLFPGCVTSRTWSACGSAGLTALECAQSQIKPTFDADPVVKIIRDGMRGIMTLSGGEDVPGVFNDALVPSGKLVDPWIDEPSCSVDGTHGPWAYPHQP